MEKNFKVNSELFDNEDGEYNDRTPCPIGVNKGAPLEDIPMYKLLKLRDWLFEKKLNDKYHKLIKYIDENEELE